MTIKQLQEQFWARFDAYFEAHPRPELKIRRDSTHPHLTKLAGDRGWAVEVRFNVRDKRIEADLTLSGASAKCVFDSLHETFAARGDAKMGCKVHWEREKPSRPNYPRPRLSESSVFVTRQNPVPDDPASWDDCSAWLIDRATTLRCWRLSV